MKKKTTEGPLELETLPGHYIRRLQQIAVAVFLQETEAHGLTPVQYAALNQVERTPGVDQRTLARLIGQDTSTTASVIDRLEARGLMRRQASPDDRRVRLLQLTDEGGALLAAVAPDIVSAQERMLSPLSPAERKEFMRMLRAIVAANKELSRVASDG
jgi:DNA-binding MarR family transcriptional regulator